MATSDLDMVWKDTFPERPRPSLYTSNDFTEDGFRPLADPLDFITDISKLTAQQLYTQATNSQVALQKSQDEYLELEKLINQLKNRDPMVASVTKNPQALPSHRDFEERKESMLYGYKYDPNKAMGSLGRWPEVTEVERRDLRGYQDPFSQGGFVPNDRQYKGILNKTKDKRNPDAWKPIEKDGRKLVPKMAARIYEKDEYAQLSGVLPLPKGMASKPATRSGTPDLESLIHGGRDTPVNKRLRSTRFNGAKVPLTRDVSEAPSLPGSRASTPKRKRGDTPIIVFEPNGSPVKKPKLIVTDADIQMPPKRKHHNQYTKAKEKAALEAIAAQKAALEAEDRLSIPVITNQTTPTPTMPIDPGNYPWSGLTDQEKRDFHWSNEMLLLAVREDPSWLNEDAKTRQKWTKKILDSKYPVRTYSMYKKWDYWRLIGEDKRPRNKKKSRDPDDDDDEPEIDEASEMMTATPSPLNRSFSMQDMEDDERGRAGTTFSPALSRLGREISAEDVKMSEVDLQNGDDSPTNGSSGSDSASQTISVNRDYSYVGGGTGTAGTTKRTTRASRKASIQE